MKNTTESSCALTALLASAAVALVMGLTGCGAVTGLSHVDLWGAKFDFAQGTDFHVGANSIDHVDDRRGVNVAAAKNSRY